MLEGVPRFIDNRVASAVSQGTAQARGREEEEARSVVPRGPAGLGQDTGSGHAASLRLEPECSANARTLSAGCMGQVGHRGSSLLLDRWSLTGLTSRGIQLLFTVGKLRHAAVPGAVCNSGVADLAPGQLLFVRWPCSSSCQPAPWPRGSWPGEARTEPTSGTAWWTQDVFLMTSRWTHRNC